MPISSARRAITQLVRLPDRRERQGSADLLHGAIETLMRGLIAPARCRLARPRSHRAAGKPERRPRESGRLSGGLTYVVVPTLRALEPAVPELAVVDSAVPVVVPLVPAALVEVPVVPAV